MDRLEVELFDAGRIEADAGDAKLVQGPKGDRGEPGPVYVPNVTGGVISWTNDGGLENPPDADIRGPKGDKGDKGDAGQGLSILGQYGSLQELGAAVPDPMRGDNYYVGTAAPYDIYTWAESEGALKWVNGGKLQGAKGEPGSPGLDGGYYTPSVDSAGNLSWSPSAEGMPGVAGANIKGPKGDDGAAGSPGMDATINGVNALTLVAGENVEIEQSGSTATLSASGAGALYVNISGTGGNMSSDKTNAEIYAAYQAGKGVYALWQDVVLVLFSVTDSSAIFVYNGSGLAGSVTILSSGGETAVYGESGELSAASVAFEPGESGLTATNVQDAIDQLIYLISAM